MKPESLFEKIFSRSTDLIQENFRVLLGEELQVRPLESRKVPPEKFFASITLPAVFSLLQVEKGYHGKSFFMITEEDAIILGCSLAMFGEGTIEEKVNALDLGKTEFDAFKETCNQLTGLLDQVFLNFLPKKIHLKLIDTPLLKDEAEIHSSLSDYFEEENFLVFSYQVVLKSKFKPVIRFVLPATVVAQMTTPGTDENPEETPEIVQQVPGEKGISAIRAMKAILVNLGDKKVSPLQKLLQEHELSFELVSKLSKLQEIISRDSVRLIIIESDGEINKGIQLCRYLSQWTHLNQVHIWVLGSDWNTKLIHQAVRAGASYLIVNPLDRDRVARRLAQVFPPQEGE